MPRLIDLEKLGELHGEADEMLKRRQARKNLRDVLSRPVEEPTPPPPPPKATTTPTSIGGLLGLDRPIRESVQEAESNVPRSQPLSGAAIPKPSTSLSGGVLGLTQPMTDFSKPSAPSKSGSLLQAATGGFKTGWYGSELGLQEYEKMWGRPNKVEEYQKILQEHPEWQEQEPFKWSDILRDPIKAVNHAVRGAAHTLALMLNLSAKAAVPAALTGIGVAVGATKAGLVDPTTAFLTSAPLAAQLGLQAANIAFTANQIRNMAKIEASDAYKEYIDSGVSPQVARVAAEITGWINGTLEYAQFAELLGAGAAGREALNQLKKNTLTAALKNVVKKWAEGVNDESLEEAAQETVTVIGKHVANAIDERLKSKSFNAQQALEGILKNKDLYGPEVQELATRGYAALSQPDNAVNRALREIATRAPQAYGEAALSFGLLQIPGIASGVGQALYEDRTRRILGNLGAPQKQAQQPAPAKAEPATVQAQAQAKEAAAQPQITQAQARPQAPTIDEMASRIREEAQKQNKKITIKSPQASWIQKTIKTTFGQNISYAQARDIARRVIELQAQETTTPATTTVTPEVSQEPATAPAAPQVTEPAVVPATAEAEKAVAATTETEPLPPASEEGAPQPAVRPWQMRLDEYYSLANQDGTKTPSQVETEHREIVSQALKEGQEVPYLVLADHPKLIAEAIPKDREAAGDKILSWINEVEQAGLDERTRETNLTRLYQLLGYYTTGVRLADAEETGKLYRLLKQGQISQQDWDNHVAQLIRENRIKDKSILGIAETQKEVSAPKEGTTVSPQEEERIASKEPWQMTKEEFTQLAVQRIEEPGKERATVDKPQGVYTTPLRFQSPHKDLGGKTYLWLRNPRAKVLYVDASEMVRTNRGLVGQSAGIAALRKLVGEEEAARLLSMSKPDLVDLLSKRYPDIDWNRYFDPQEILEGYAGILAREAGYDAIYGEDKNAPEYTEFVALTDNAMVPVEPHEEIVKQAIAQGKPVPQEVLKDYPDLVASEKRRAGTSEGNNFGRETERNKEVPREEGASVPSEQSLDSHAFASPQLAEWAKVAYEKSKNKEYVLNVVQKVNELYTSLPQGVQEWINRRIDSRRPFIVIRDSINDIPEQLRPTFMQGSAVTVNHARIELVADLHKNLDPEILAHELVHLAWNDLEESAKATIDRIVQESVEAGNKIIEFVLKKKAGDFPSIAHHMKNVKGEILRYTRRKNKGENIDLTSALEMELALGGSLSVGYVAEEAGVNIDSTDVITIAYYNALAKRLGVPLDSAYGREEIVAYYAGQNNELLAELFGPFAQRQAEKKQASIEQQTTSQVEKKTPVVTGKTAVAKTERGTSVETQYAVVDANDLIASHTTSLTPNPAYPAELQPRNRARAASEEQVTRMLGNLEPSFLGESPKASEGAPIVSPDLVVESGNARVITLQRGYEQKHANMAKYKEWLLQNAEEFGLDRSAIEKIERPVLVRIRRTDVDRVKFVQEANEQAVAAMSASEQAMADAKKLTGDALAMFVANEQGEILTGPNMGFIQWFMANVVAPTERGRYMTSEGTISQEGVNRIKYAIFARAYGDTAAIEKLAESTDNNVRNITNAMLMAAPQLAKIRDGAEQGYLYPLDITSDIAEAMKKLSALREQGMTVEEYLSQLGLFGDDLSPLAKEILRVFDKHARSAKKLTQILLAYAQAVQNLGNPNQQNLFEEVKVPTKLELFRSIVKQLSSDTGQAQGSLFALKAGIPDPAVKAKADTALAARIEERRSSGLSLLVFAPEKTSVKQVARGLRIGVEKGIFAPGMVVADVGGGLYDDGTRYMEEHGITNLVYDPYARTEAHNSRVLDTIKSRGGADAVALNNVLNVIPKAEDRASVLQFAYSLLKDGGQMVITVYAGDGSGKGAMKEFRDGTYTWQENRKLETYKDEIAQALPGATIEKKYNAFIVTKKAQPQADETLQALVAPKTDVKGKAIREKLNRRAESNPVPLIANEDLLRLYRISPKATRQMVNIIGKAINSAVRRGRLHRAVVRGTRGKLLGVHDALTQAIRIHKKAWGSWRVMGHELGHAIMTFTNIRPDQREMAAIARAFYPEKPPVGKLTSEGFADFMALWFVDNLRARQLAPRTAKMIDNILEDNPQLKKAFNTALKIAAADQEASGLDRWSNYIYTRDEKLSEPTGGEYRIESLLKRGLFEAVDFTIPLKDMMQVAAEHGYKGLDFSKLAAISGAAWKRAIQWIKGKPKDFAGRLLLPEDARTLGDIIREAEKLPGGLERFDQVYHVLRYYERWKKGFEPPVPIEDLKADVKEIMTKHREMAKLVQEYATNLSEIRLRMLVRYGVISQETADRVRAGSKFYLPLITPRSSVAETTLAGEKDNRAAGQPVKQYAPKSDVTLDFLEASTYSLYQVAIACELNCMMQSIHKALSRKGMGLFGEVIDSPKILKIISTADLSKQLEKQLGEFLEGDVNLNEDPSQVFVKLFLPGTIKDTPCSEPIIMARYGNKKVYMRVAPDVYKSVLAMRPLTLNLAQKALAQMGRISRAGALFNVRYITNNLMRDILAAQIQTESPERLFVISSLKGAAAAAGLDPDLVDLYIQSGAYGSAPTEFLESAVRSYKGLGLYPTKAAGWVRTAKGTLIRLVHTPADAVRIFEEGPRIAEFEAVLRKRLAEIEKKTGKEITLKDVVRGKYDPDLAEAVEMALVDAAYASHEVTTNFALHGASSWVRGYVQLVPFLHGSIQGLYRAGRQFAQKPATTLLRIGLYLIPLTVMAFAVNHDEPEYEDIPSQARDRYWFFPLKKGFYIAIAKPYEYSLLINLMERYLDWAWAKSSPMRRKPLEDVGQMLRNQFSLPFIPLWAEAIMALAMNRDSFGTPIVPMSEKDLEPEMRYSPTQNSKAAIELSRLMARLTKGQYVASPRQIDFLIENTLGGIGKTGMSLISEVLNRATGKREGRTWQWTLDYNPVFGSLVYGPTEGGSRIIDRFYRDMERANRKYQSWLETQKTGRKPVNEITKEDAKLIKAYPAMKAISNMLAKERAALAAIQNDPSVKPEIKEKARLRYAWINKVAAGFLYAAPVPTPHPKAGITPAEAEDLLRYLDYLTRKAIVNALKRPGGPI